MPPKAASSSSSVGRPRAAASEDPAVELKRQKQREAAARYRAKMSSSKSTASAMSATPSTFSMSSASAAKPIVGNKALLKGFNENEGKKAKAKGVLTSAVQGNKARDEMRKLKEAKLQANAVKYMEKLGIKKGDDLVLKVKLLTKDIRTLLIQQFPEHWKFIKKKEKEKGMKDTIELKYKPYMGYNYFGYMYKDDSGNMKEYPMKIEVSVDENYSNYLQDQFWRMDYWLWKNSQGIFPYDVLKKAEVKNDQYFADELLLEQYPVPEFEQGSPPAGMQEVNDISIGKRHADIFDEIKHRRDKKYWDKYYAPLSRKTKFDLGTRDRLQGVMSVPTSPSASPAIIKRPATSMGLKFS